MVLCAGRRHEDALLELGCSHNDLPIGVSIQPPLVSAQSWVDARLTLALTFLRSSPFTREQPSKARLSITSFLLIIHLSIPTMFAANEESSNFCNSWLRSEHLVSIDAIQQALQELPVGLFDERQSEGFLRELLSANLGTRPILELVLSAGNWSKCLATSILDTFPQSAKTFPQSSCHLVLDRLSLFLLFLPHTFDREASELLSSNRVSVEMAPQVLMALASMSFSSDDQDGSDMEIDDDMSFFKPKRETQRQRKRAKRMTTKRTITPNPKPFEAMGLSIPSTAQDANEQIVSILDEQKEILKFYLATLQDSEVAATIQRGFIPVEATGDTPPADTIKERRQPILHADGEVGIDTPAAFPMVQPMKAALYFDSALGFGEWRILISTRADRDLRESRRKDAHFFKIVIKKIKELSNGHFSADNQKRLNGINTEIPIYEAKMTRDSRLVYQVDCIPEYDTDVERQVIKIFGVYTHAQLDKRLWDSMGHQLGRKGKQYRERCTFRNRPHHAGDNVVLPAYFPPPEKKEEEDVCIVPELPKEDLEELHSLLVLEKFVTFSQALLNSIIADLDVAHVFNVTPQEKAIIEHPYSCYVLGRSGTGKTTTMLFKMLGIERAFQAQQHSISKPRQLFVTQSRVLAGKVEEYFAKLLESLSTAGQSPKEMAKVAKSKKLKEEGGLIDLDDDVAWRADLPQKFSLLQDEHFPLFLTFDRLAKLLEADITLKSRMTTPLNADLSFGQQATGRLITYDVFLRSYWPHFSQTLTKGLDPSLVFSEFIGVIKGSEESLSHENRFLDKSEYENLSHRAQYAFANQRDVIYSIFSSFRKHKSLCGDYDAADRTHNILKAIEAVGIPGPKIDYLYVDEAQDNLLIDALLLRSLCRNPDGLFWAGDTAQTISVGSSFRFNDLKAFLFRLEKRRENMIADRQPTREVPRTFQLAINYRSHGGIVNCAHSVIELITEFWPYAIDVLGREQGVVDGSKPVFFSGWDKETVRYEQFLFGASGSRIEFGAQQCILVRDESARDELREQVGDIGLIMTLYESKGLEFDDVLLYKFFEDSSVDLSQWRVVLNQLGDEENLDVPAPQFDDTRHAGVCSELKFLYVAITRARKNLWIVDCSETSEPMRIFWTSKNQIQNCTPGTDVPRLAVSSSPQEWEKSGRTLFQNKRYLQAMHCFERAGLNREVSVSRTYYLREQARATPTTGSRQALKLRQNAFTIAAEAFLQCAVAATSSREKNVYFRNAGDCFEHADNDCEAAQAYVKAREFGLAVKLYRKCGMFDEAVDVVTTHREDIEADVAENLLDVARLFYFNRNELEKAKRLFSSDEEQLQYLEDYDLDISRAAVLAGLGRLQEAATIHLAEGRMLEAIRLLLEDGKDQGAIRRGHECLLEGLWKHLSFGVKYTEGARDIKPLLEFASNSKLSLVDSSASDQLAMFQAVASCDLNQLRALGQKFASRKEVTSALLCFDHYFQNFPRIIVMEATEISTILADFLSYCSMLREVAISPDPCNNAAIQKLFGFQASTENIFLLPEGTYLHQSFLALRAAMGVSEQGALVTEWDLSQKFKDCLFTRISNRIKEENDICRRTQAFTPCLPFVINDVCNRLQCPRKHIHYTSCTPAWYNVQVRIHLQQILIFHNLHSVQFDVQERHRQHRFWINRLHETLNPSIYYLGTLANLDVALIKEAQKAVEVVKRWCRDLLDSPMRLDARLLTTVYQTANLCLFLDKQSAREYIHRAPILDVFAHQPQYRRELNGRRGPRVVNEMMRFLQGTDEVFIPAGLCFVKHLLTDSVPIDINVLCDAIDFLCGAVVIVRKEFVLHNVTLPRSWFITLLRRIKKDTKRPATLMLNFLLNSVKLLVERLQSGVGSGQLLFENTDLSELPAIRVVFLTRVCKAICLVGYNMNHDDLRQEIVRILGPVRTGRPHYLNEWYAHARNWNQLAQAVHHSTTESSLDELIQLYDDGKKLGRYKAPQGVRRVFFKTIEDVPRLLSDASTPSFLSSLRPDAPTFVPRARQNATPDDTKDQRDKPGEFEVDIEEPDVEHMDVLSPNNVVESIASTALSVEHKPPSAEQIHAARVFQVAYRKAMSRRRKMVKTAAEASRASLFDACLAESRTMEWPHNYYRLLFLGPLPHVLVCISGVQSYVVAAKEKAKKRWSRASHQELEDIGKRRTELNGIFRDAQRLYKALQPQSELHRRRDLTELKTRVLEVEMLHGRVPPGACRDVREDLDLALKAIVAVKQPIKAKPKPELCMDDDDEYIG